MSMNFLRRRLIAGATLLALSGAPAFAQQEVKLGAFVTLSGISADVGAQMKAGIEVAVEAAQPTFAINGVKTPIKVIWYDDEGKGDTGLNVVTRALTVDKITAGVGFLSSDVFIRVMDEFQKAKTPIVTCCSASLGIGKKIADNKMEYVFQLSPTANDIATSVIAAVGTLEKPTKVAMLNENTDSGHDFSRISQEWLKANAPKIEVVADEFVPRGAPDLTPQLAKFKRLGAQAIVGEVYGTAAPVYFRQWNELRVPALIAHMGTSASADSFVAEHGKEMEGSLINVRWIPGKYTDVSEPMIEAYKKKTGFSPSTFAVQAHDAALVVLQAIQKAGSTDPAKIAAALEANKFIAAWGERKFTPLAEGHRMPVYPADVAAAQGPKYRPVPPWGWAKK